VQRQWVWRLQQPPTVSQRLSQGVHLPGRLRSSAAGGLLLRRCMPVLLPLPLPQSPLAAWRLAHGGAMQLPLVPVPLVPVLVRVLRELQVPMAGRQSTARLLRRSVLPPRQPRRARAGNCSSSSARWVSLKPLTLE
jgi:hypothetical protein